jgi:Dockerin type I domain
MKSQRSNRNRPNRKLVPEALEARQLMASDLAHNFLLPHDVNDDHRVTPSDALMVINKLNRRGMDDTPQTSRSHFEDVNDDSRLTPSDALTVINRLNSQAAVTGQPAAKEARVSSATSAAIARFEFETSGSEIEMSIKVIGAAASTSYAVSLNDFALGQLTTDDRGRGRLVLSQGDDNREHLPLPNNLPPITADTELIIGDIVRGRLSTFADDNNDDGGNSNSSSKSNQGGSSSSSNSSSGGNSSSTNQSESEWLATFTSVGKFRRKAEFEVETEDGLTKSKFKAQIEGGAANTTYDVTVGGVSVGQVKTDARGKAKFILSTSPKRGELSMPANFPTVDATTVVTIGDASATFVRIR